MKKFVVLCLLLVYGATSFGFSLNLHYCCGQLENVSLFKNDHNCMPGVSSMAAIKKQCCADEQLTVKMKADQAASFHAVKFFKYEQAKPEYSNFETVAVQPRILLLVSAQPNAPPGAPVPLFIQHCVFRV